MSTLFNEYNRCNSPDQQHFDIAECEIADISLRIIEFTHTGFPSVLRTDKARLPSPAITIDFLGLEPMTHCAQIVYPNHLAMTAA